MSLLKSRKKTTRARRAVRRNGDLQKLHINVSSPRIVMLQVMSGLGKAAKLLMFLGFLGLLAWGGYRGINHLFLGNEKYKLQEIDLQTNGHLDHARMVRVTGIDLDASIFSIDVTEVEDKLHALPEIVSCDVERRLPGTLKVSITERVPAVWLECAELDYPGRDSKGVLVDANGISFPCEGNMWESAQDLPVIVIHDVDEDSFVHGGKMKHPDAMRALHLIETFKSSDVRAQWQPERIVLINDYSMQAVCNDGAEAIFGMYDHQRQVEDFITICEHSLGTDREVRHINLIPKKNIPVKFAGDPVMVMPRRSPGPVDPDEKAIDSILDRN